MTNVTVEYSLAGIGHFHGVSVSLKASMLVYTTSLVKDLLDTIVIPTPRALCTCTYLGGIFIDMFAKGNPVTIWLETHLQDNICIEKDTESKELASQTLGEKTKGFSDLDKDQKTDGTIYVFRVKNGSGSQSDPSAVSKVYPN